MRLAPELQERSDMIKKLSFNYWEEIHNKFADKLALMPELVELHIERRVADTQMMPREEVIKQHEAYHMKKKDKLVLLEKSQVSVKPYSM
jgi:hypothetical protein